jgi:hypothetical protein
MIGGLSHNGSSYKSVWKHLRTSLNLPDFHQEQPYFLFYDHHAPPSMKEFWYNFMICMKRIIGIICAVGATEGVKE